MNKKRTKSAVAKQEVVARAKARFLRISPRKVRSVINLIRGSRVEQAFATLSQVNKRAKRYIEKLLRSALSNAKQNPSINVNNLFVSGIKADQGPTLKRFRAAAMGRATRIRHRTTHLSVELSKLSQDRQVLKAKENKAKPKNEARIRAKARVLKRRNT